MTYTYSILHVSQSTYQEVRDLLVKAGYHHAFHEHEGDECIDMHGIALKVTDEHDWGTAEHQLNTLIAAYAGIGPAGFFGGGVIASLKERYDNGERTQALWDAIQRAE